MNQPLYMSFVWFIVIVGGAFFLALLLQKLNSTGRKIIDNKTVNR